jgi:hypothetical protein
MRKVERSHRLDQQELYQLLDKDGIADDTHLFNKWEDWAGYRHGGCLAAWRCQWKRDWNSAP